MALSFVCIFGLPITPPPQGKAFLCPLCYSPTTVFYWLTFWNVTSYYTPLQISSESKEPYGTEVIPGNFQFPVCVCSDLIKAVHRGFRSSFWSTKWQLEASAKASWTAIWVAKQGVKSMQHWLLLLLWASKQLRTPAPCHFIFRPWFGWDHFTRHQYNTTICSATWKVYYSLKVWTHIVMCANHSHSDSDKRANYSLPRESGGRCIWEQKGWVRTHWR